MSKAEKFISDYTRNCSNEMAFENEDGSKLYHPWLTPEQARSVAEIAREETIKEVCEWIKNNAYTYTWCEFSHHERGIETGKLIEDLKKHFKGEA